MEPEIPKELQGEAYAASSQDHILHTWELTPLALDTAYNEHKRKEDTNSHFI